MSWNTEKCPSQFLGAPVESFKILVLFGQNTWFFSYWTMNTVGWLIIPWIYWICSKLKVKNSLFPAQNVGWRRFLRAFPDPDFTVHHSDWLTDLSVGVQGVSAGYLPLGVAAPGVNVSRGGEHQSVFSSDSHILDVDPWQGRDLLGSVVVPGSAFWQAN